MLCNMSNLHCPDCGRLIGTLNAATQPSDTAQHAADERIATWLMATLWRPTGRVLTADALARYRAETGDRVTSHRAFSIAMQHAGIEKRAGSHGVRIFVWPH
jgi:hypothetical protein